MRKLLICLFVVLATPVFATTWQEANKASVAALNAGKYNDAAALAQQAIDLYMALPTFKPETYANLSLNLVDINLTRNDLNGAEETIDRAVKVLKQHGNGNPPALIAIYKQRANLRMQEGNFKGASAAFLEAKAVAAANYGAADIRTTQFLMEIADLMKQVKGRTEARQYVDMAWSAVKALPSNDDRRLYVEINQAKLELESGHEDKAEPMYLSIIDRLRAKPRPDPVMLRAAVGQLAYIYIEDGREADADRVIAYTSVLPYPTGAPEPIVRISARRTSAVRYAGKSGFARIEFVVTAEGRVKDPKVTETNGNAAFTGMALSSLRLWRFQPRAVNGVPVETPGMVINYVFSVENETPELGTRIRTSQ